ncbi:MAG TPA: DNA repair protein RecN [Methylophilaceae bacterium]|nr:DNA repair protein RecN [Methylophilaceae bacterium]
MLQTLSIRDFVIVDKLDLEFSPGFTVLTGETGAGKSILIDALSLALGARGEGGITRVNCEKAEIVASFHISALPELQSWLDEHEFTAEDQQLLLRRIIYADGRSRAFINGTQATIQQLREVGDFLIDIYSQHAHHSLLKQTYQRQVLDAYAGLQALAAEVAKQYRIWRELHEKRVEMDRNAATYAEELAELRDQVHELKQLAPVMDEWEAMQQEHARLAHGASLLEGAEECRALLDENEYAATTQLGAIQHKLQELLEYDGSLQEVLDLVDSASIQLEETSRFLNRYLQRTELDPERLAEVEANIQAIHTASRKYRVRPEELPALLERSQVRMDALEGFGTDGELAGREAEAERAYQGLAQQLSAHRREAAEKLSAEITTEMQRLALAGGSFAVDLNPQEPAASGLEQIEFLVAGHPGAALRPLSKVASGGELSRISLAIRVTTAQQGDIPTMIFDEVDVGIGGGVAEIVGQLLKQLGEKRQVLVITHLPQVAAQGSYHLRVSKTLMEGATLSRIERLEQVERIEEIARMLGGVDITSTTRKHAEEMLRV